MHRWWTAVAMTVCPRVALACGVGADEPMVRRYADGMVDSNTALHRRTVSNAVGSVPLGAEALEALAADPRAGLSLNRGSHKRCGGATGEAISMNAVTIPRSASHRPGIAGLQHASRRQKP